MKRTIWAWKENISVFIDLMTDIFPGYITCSINITLQNCIVDISTMVNIRNYFHIGLLCGLWLSNQVSCNPYFRNSYVRKVNSCSLAGLSEQIVTVSESKCKSACLQASDGCEAYKWDASSGACFIQETVSVTESTTPGDTISVMMTMDLPHTTCAEENTCPAGFLCVDLPCAGMNPTCILAKADCAEILTSDPASSSGVYSILPAGTQQIKQVWCDMDTDGGGWTAFLQRINGSVDFYQDLAAYTQGFGDVNGEYWLGLDALHAMTAAKTYQIRADMSDWDGASAHSLFASMVVADASDDYRLTVGALLGGDGGDCLITHNQNMPFSAKDADRDNLGDKNCAQFHTGGFWYNTCSACHPTAKYYPGGDYTNPDGDGNNGIQWRSWSLHTSFWYSLKTVDMKLRP